MTGFTRVSSAAGFSDAGTTVDTSSTLNVVAGDVLMAWAWFSYTDSTATIADTSSGNSFTMTTRRGSNPFCYFGYVLNATANSSSTFRMTISGFGAFAGLIVEQWRPSSGYTASVDSGDSFNSGSGSSSSTSGAITTAGADVLFAGVGMIDNNTVSSMQFEGVAADGSTTTTRGAMWYKEYASSQTDINATANLQFNTDWGTNIYSLLISAPTPSGIPIAWVAA